jgi:hypothetical protein
VHGVRGNSFLGAERPANHPVNSSFDHSFRSYQHDNARRAPARRGAAGTPGGLAPAAPHTPMKDRLDMIANRGAAGKPYLVRREPLETRNKLKNAAGGYRRTYGKAGFTFEVRKLPGEDMVGLWTVWTPTDGRPSV